jgi:2-polyprenyl-6-methoxyphenol hydroxylase-like FAD-dependent oxidoreductase
LSAGPSTTHWNREDWTDRATVARALAAFAGWHEQVRTIIAAAETCFIWALFDRDPLPRWSLGHTTLLGDACHPMYPFMGQGAAMAIEDGATLAACLRAVEDPAEGLQQYERLRLPRVILLQAMSRANKIRFHMPDGLAQQHAALALRLRRRPHCAQVGVNAGFAKWAIAASAGSDNRQCSGRRNSTGGRPSPKIPGNRRRRCCTPRRVGSRSEKRKSP